MSINEIIRYGTDLSIVKDSLKIVNRDTLYNLLDLVSFPQINISGIVIEINKEKNLIIVDSDDCIKYVKFNDKTTFNGLYLTDLLDNLEVSDEITIYFDYLFAGYNPKVIMAVNIIK